MIYKAFIDGACRGNPGPGGIGVAIYQNESDYPLMEIDDFIGMCTNNKAEYMSLIRALEELHALGAKKVIIYSDSQLLVRQMDGKYKVKSENLIPLYAKATRLAQKFAVIKFVDIRREKNKLADKLANRGIDKAIEPR